MLLGDPIGEKYLMPTAVGTVTNLPLEIRVACSCSLSAPSSDLGCFRMIILGKTPL